MEVDIFYETDEDLLVWVEALPVVKDLEVARLGPHLRVVEAFKELLFGGRFHRLPLEEIPCYEHVETPHRGRVDPLDGITHEEDDPGVRHQAVDAGDAFLFEDRVLWCDLTLRFPFCALEEGGIPFVRRGTPEESEVPQQTLRI